MKISTKGRYGLRAMVDLSRHFGEGPIMMGSIAARQDLSPKYLHALLASLRAAGLIRSVRGTGGGYMLARAPETIPVRAVITALEGPLELTDCVGSPTICSRSGECLARQVWLEMSQAMNGVLEELTLADLLARESKAANA